MGKEQQYGENPIAQRKTDLYKREYVQSFVRKWDELIDWDARATSEGDFFISILKERGVKRVLDNTLAFFLAEASYNGDHYRTIYHPDWNTVGPGFYFEHAGDGRYKVYCAFHYGSLER